MTTASPTPTIEVRRAASRGHTDIGWLDSRHSFSFGSYRDQRNTGHGLLIVNNDDRVAPAKGFGTHPHRDMEIVTWVLAGEVEHADSMGNHGVIRPGLAQRMTAGTGIEHSEFNPDPDIETHLVQMWVLPDTAGLEPGYEQVDVTDRLEQGGLVLIAGGPDTDAAIHINQRDASMSVGRLQPDEAVLIPDAPHVHVFLAIGEADLVGVGALGQGDAVRLTDGGTPLLTAGPEGAEIIVWATA
jgi:redox-sensitive bicupin YhaK (pirin superfamily)